MMSRTNTTILISGASIAGPTLAYWLKRSGFTRPVGAILTKSRDR